MIKTKTCSACWREKPIENFKAFEKYKDGYSYFCSECAREEYGTWTKRTKHFVIYGLLDPITKELRYVGMTLWFFNRIRGHLRNKNLKDNVYKNNWIKSLIAQKLLPIPVVIELHSNLKDLEKAEIFYIAYFKSIGARLTNIAPGGSFYIVNFSDEQKLAIGKNSLGRKLSDETKDKMRQSKLGANNPNFGKKGKGNKRQLTFQQAQEIRGFWATGNFTYTKLAQNYNVNLGIIINIINNKGYLAENKINTKRYLTFEQAEEIRKLWATGSFNQNELAKKYNVSWIVVRDILSGASYKS